MDCKKNTPPLTFTPKDSLYILTKIHDNFANNRGI